MRVAVAAQLVVLACLLNWWSGIGAECLPSVGELRLLGEQGFSGGLAGVSLDPSWNAVAWVDAWSVRLADPHSGEELGRVLAPLGLRFVGRPATGEGGLLAIALSDGTVRVWEVPAGREVASFPAPLWGGCAALSGDGSLLAIPGPEGDLRVWHIPSGELRFSFTELLPLGQVCPVAFSPDGRWLVGLAGAGLSPVAPVWDLTTGRLVRIFPGLAQLLPNGQVSLLIREVTATRIEVWEDPGGRRSSTIRLPTGWEVSQFASHPGGSMFALALADGTIRLWDARSGLETGALPSCIRTDPRTGEAAQGLLVKFSPAGNEILLGMLFPETMRGTIYLWTFSQGNE